MGSDRRLLSRPCHFETVEAGRFSPGAANVAAGFGDAITFGATKRIRQSMGTDQAVDRCSTVYAAGRFAGTQVGAAILTAGVGGGTNCYGDP